MRPRTRWGRFVRDLTARAAETGTVSETLGSAVARQRAAAAAVGTVVARFTEGAARQDAETRIMTEAFDDMVQAVERVATTVGEVAAASDQAAEAATSSAALMEGALARHRSHGARGAGRRGAEPLALRLDRSRRRHAADPHRHRGADEHARIECLDRGCASRPARARLRGGGGGSAPARRRARHEPSGRPARRRPGSAAASSRS